MSHTPGPWSIEEHGKGFALYSGRDDMRHGMNLVYLSEPDWNWKANAKLIAAAPDLLESLLEIEQEFINDPAHGALACRMYKIAREAIKKARGDK
jgi:hypothetical protein